MPGEWYKVYGLENDWALALWEADSPSALAWIPVGASVELIAISRRVPPAPQEIWLVVMRPSQTYSGSGVPRRVAQTGDRYRVIAQDTGWVFGIRDSEQPGQAAWLELDSRVQIVVGEPSPGLQAATES
jgi:hypothetical protein